MTSKNKIRGKKARASGARFELKVRKDLESKKWICDRWTSNVEFHNDEDVNEFPFTTGKLVPAKPKTLFIKGRRIIINMWTGFPDFISFKIDAREKGELYEHTRIHGIECKSNGYLTKEEKEKCGWLVKNKVFEKILIAKKGKERGKIVYKEFEVN